MQQDQMQEIRQTVPVNVYRTPDRVVVAAPMPGVLPEDLTINVTAAGRLVLQSRLRGVLRAEFFDVEPTEEKHSAAPVAPGDHDASGERSQENKQVLLDEWSAGGYYREVDLPAAVDAALATVTYGNGVLVVALPVTAEVRSARLSLVAVGDGRGQRLGSAGHPVKPLRP